MAKIRNIRERARSRESLEGKLIVFSRNKVDQRAQLLAEFYDALIDALRYKAQSCGYAIAVHGSLRRDIDLICCPWRVSRPISPHSLIQHLKKVVEAVTGTARERECDHNPSQKPWGRLAWSVYLSHDDNGPYLDISVMPIVEPVTEPVKVTKAGRGK